MKEIQFKTYAERFDIVYQAWLQSGKTPFFNDMYMEAMYPDFVELTKKHAPSCEDLSDEEKEIESRMKETLARVVEALKKSPIINQRKIYVPFPGMHMEKRSRVDECLYQLFQMWDERFTINFYSVSEEVSKIIETVKIEDFDESLEKAGYDIFGIYEIVDSVIGIVPCKREFLPEDAPKDMIVQILTIRTGSHLEGKDTYREMVNYVLKLHALMDAEKSPVKASEPRISAPYTREKNYTAGTVYHKTINLTKEYKDKVNSYMKGNGTKLNKENLILSISMIKGFLRTQHYGKDNSLTKRIFVDGFERGQWKRTASNIRVISKN